MTEKEKRSLKIRLGKRLSYDKRRVMEIIKEEIDKMETTTELPHGEWETKTIIDKRTGKKIFHSFCPCCGTRFVREEGEAE